MIVGTQHGPSYRPEQASAVHAHRRATLACGGPAGALVELESAAPELLWLRRLGRADLPDLEMHLLGLDKGDRRARFGSALSDDAIVAYTQGIDTTRGILIGASPLSGTRLIGAAEAQITGTRGRVEIAVSVHARLREQGLGTLLVNAVLHAAFGAGATAAEFVFSPENRPIVGLVRGLGARMYPTLDGAKIHSGNYRPGATLSATLTMTGTIWARDV